MSFNVRPIEDADINSVIRLWTDAGVTRPWNDPRRDIELCRKGSHSTILVGQHAGSIAATVQVGEDGHRGWVYYVAVDPGHQGKDLGRGIMAAAEDWLRARGIEKLMLLVRSDNTKVQKFYERLDYVEQDRVIYAKWLDGRPMTP